MSDSASLDREFYADGTRYDDDGIQGVVWDFPEFLGWTETGLTNAIAYLQKAITEQSGVIYGQLTPEPNPGAAPNTVRIGTGYAIIPDGSVLYVDSEIDITGITSADEGKNIILKRSRGHYNERNVRVENLDDVPVLRKHTVSSDVVASGDVDSTDTVVYTISDVAIDGSITGHTASVNYYIPELGPPGSMESERFEPVDLNDMMGIPSIPKNLAEQMSYFASLFNRIVHGTSRYSGGFDDLDNVGEPDPVTNVATETNMMESLVYDDLTVGIESNLSYIKISWGAAAAGVDPHYYIVELIPINKIGGVDTEITAKTHRYNTKDYSTTSTVTELTVYNIPPNIKFKPRVVAVTENVFGDQYSEWANGDEFFSGGGSSGVSVPDGGTSLSVSGGNRSFSLSWTSVGGASFYNVYVKEGGAPSTSDDTYLYKKSHKSTTIIINWGGYSDSTFYFKIVPYNDKGVAASWSIDGSGTMSSDDVALTTSERDAVANETSAAASLTSFIDGEGANTVPGAMKSFSRTEDVHIPAVQLSGVTPAASSGATIYRRGGYYCPGTYEISRVVAHTYEQGATFDGETKIWVYINDVKNDDLTLTCEDGASGAKITKVNFGTILLSEGDIIYTMAVYAGSSPTADINVEVSVRPYYPVT